jgi:hypothetical protein
MTNEDDMIIREAARAICALQAWKHDSLASQNYLSGKYDQTIWMRLVEQGIRRGIEIGRAL